MKKFWEFVKKFKDQILVLFGCIFVTYILIEFLPLRFCIILLYISFPVLLFVLVLVGEFLWKEFSPLLLKFKKKGLR